MGKSSAKSLLEIQQEQAKQLEEEKKKPVAQTQVPKVGLASTIFLSFISFSLSSIHLLYFHDTFLVSLF